jgi:batD protein
MVNGKQHKSNALNIKVLPADSKQQATQQNSKRNSGQASHNIGAEDLFIRPILSKATVREQEMVLLTYKIYYKVDLVNIVDIKMPDFEGLMTHDIEVKKPQDIENYNGQNYYTSILKQMLISPQRAGKITIGNMTGTAIVRTRQVVRDPNSFFGAYSTYQDVKKQLSSGIATLNVTPLPQPKPDDFGGAVGNLSMTSSISSENVEANSSIVLKINIKGTGNLKLIKTPKIDFPTDFEQYDPKVDNKFNVSTSGFSGSKTIEYVVIPRHSGRYDIPSTKLVYFDLSTNKYKTLSTESYTVNVSKGKATADLSATTTIAYNNKEQEQVKHIASDIQYIKTGNLHIKPYLNAFVGTAIFWICLLIPLIIAIMLGIIFNKKAKENANIALVKNKKANKIAKKRLKVAEKYLRTDNKEMFYDEMLSAIWLYLSDKLNIPLSQLNKDNTRDGLLAKSVAQEIVDEALTLLTDCEFERYAYGGDIRTAMDNIYNRAVETIGKIENNIRK